MREVLSSALSLSSDSGRSSQIAAYAARRAGLSSAAKRGFDVSVAAAFLVLFLPMLATLVILVLLVQGRPVFIRHRRVGKDGTLFGCLKFRSMTVDADAVLRAHLATNPEAKAEWDATRKLKDDPRITPLGHMIRKTSIDELPQLINVLRGEMSLVGPRPIVPDEVPFYGSDYAFYKSVRPGLTGSWQVGGRSDVSYPTRVRMDADYVANWSFGQDMLIIAKTVPAVLRSKGSY